jgi:hypothetical protein
VFPSGLNILQISSLEGAVAADNLELSHFLQEKAGRSAEFFRSLFKNYPLDLPQTVCVCLHETSVTTREMQCGIIVNIGIWGDNFRQQFCATHRSETVISFLYRYRVNML